MTVLAALATAVRERLAAGHDAPLPGFGTLTRQHIPARVQTRPDGTRVLLPPSETVRFTLDASDPSAVAAALARTQNVPEDRAAPALRDAVDQLEAIVVATGEARLPGVGLFRRTSSSVLFASDTGLLAEINRPYAGLRPVEAAPLPTPAPPAVAPAADALLDASTPHDPPADPPATRREGSVDDLRHGLAMTAGLGPDAPAAPPEPDATTHGAALGVGAASSLAAGALDAATSPDAPSAPPDATAPADAFAETAAPSGAVGDTPHDGLSDLDADGLDTPGAPSDSAWSVTPDEAAETADLEKFAPAPNDAEEAEMPEAVGEALDPSDDATSGETPDEETVDEETTGDTLGADESGQPPAAAGEQVDEDGESTLASSPASDLHAGSEFAPPTTAQADVAAELPHDDVPAQVSADGAVGAHEDASFASTDEAKSDDAAEAGTGSDAETPRSAEAPRSFDAFLDTLLPIGTRRTRRRRDRSTASEAAPESDLFAPAVAPAVAPAAALPDAQPQTEPGDDAIGSGVPEPDGPASQSTGPQIEDLDTHSPSPASESANTESVAHAVPAVDRADVWVQEDHALPPGEASPVQPMPAAPVASADTPPTADWSQADAAMPVGDLSLGDDLADDDLEDFAAPEDLAAPPRDAQDADPAMPSPLDEIYATDRDRPFEDPESLLGLDLGAASASATALGMGLDGTAPPAHDRRATDRVPAAPLAASPATPVVVTGAAPGGDTTDRWFSFGSLLLLAVSLAAIAAAASWPQFAGTPAPSPTPGGGAFGDTLGDAAQAAIRERQALAAGDTARTPGALGTTADGAETAAPPLASDAPATPSAESYEAVEIAPDAVPAPAPPAERRTLGVAPPAGTAILPPRVAGLPPAQTRGLASRDGIARGDAFTWVVLSTPGQAEARTLADRYRQSGYRAGVVATTAAGRTTYRVGVGQFDSRSDAQTVRPRLPPQAPDDTWLLDLSSSGLSF